MDIEEEDYCIRCKKGILTTNKCEFCKEVFCKECEKEKCAVCTISFQDEKCPICLEHIDIEKSRYFTCHNCASISCHECISKVDNCPCCRDELKTPKLYLLKKFHKIVKIKPDIINNIIGCILCRSGMYKESKKYFRRSKLKLAKQNLDIVKGKNIDYTKFVRGGFWYINLYQLNISFTFILDRVEFPLEHKEHLAKLFYDLEQYEKFINLVSTMSIEKNGYIQHGLGDCYYFGCVLKQNYEKAVEFFIKSIENGCYNECTNIGMFYMKGSCGLDIDYDKAEKYFLMALEHYNNKEKYLYLSELYKRKGEIIKSLEWIKKGTEAGFSFEEDISKMFKIKN